MKKVVFKLVFNGVHCPSLQSSLKKETCKSNCFFVVVQVITDDDVDRISLCVRVVAERVPLMKNIFTVECRHSLSSMLDANKRGEEEKLNKVSNMFYA